MSFLIVHIALLFSCVPAFSQVCSTNNAGSRGVSHQGGVVETSVTVQSNGASGRQQELQMTGTPSYAGSSEESPTTAGPGEDARIRPLVERPPNPEQADFNRKIYFRNKLEFSLQGAWLPINVPFPLDVFEGDPYNLYPLRYTLVPIIASLRWHMGDIWGPRILRGNWDLTFSGSATAIPKGPETRYFSYDMGIRRNFVPRNWRAAPFWDLRLGMGGIDAKGGPHGVPYAQGQDFTFTAQMGAGARYNFNPRCAISAGLNYMHISNAGLSGKTTNYGINVYGPMFGIDVQLRKHARTF
jgi:hypothetical protein